MEKIQTVVFIALVVAILFFLYANWRRNWDTTNKGRVAPKTRTRIAPRSPLPSAKSSLDVVRNLRSSNAQWPTILEQLNPTRHDSVARLLLDLRGPHLFNPRVALSVIEEGLESALKANANASNHDGLEAAKRSMESITRYGD